MTTPKRWIRTVLLIASVTVPITVGCAARVRYYDVERRDYHHWDADEDRRYREYLNERHEEYHDFQKQNAEQQRDYWKWRHDHN